MVYQVSWKVSWWPMSADEGSIVIRRAGVGSFGNNNHKEMQRERRSASHGLGTPRVCTVFLRFTQEMRRQRKDLAYLYGCLRTR